MRVLRWSSVIGVALTILVAMTAAPSAFAQGASEAPAAPVLPILNGRAGVGMVSPGTGLLTFNTADPKNAQKKKTITGLSGDTLIGIDYRPKTGKLYGVGLSGKIFEINDQTAAAKQVGKLSVKLSGSSGGKAYDIDFNAAGDQLRIISDLSQNIRQPFNATGPTGSTVTDGKLSRKNIAAMAYDDSNRLLDIDTAKSQVALQNPQSGVLTDLGKPGVFGTISTSSNGFDIVGSDSFAVVNLNHDHTLFAVGPADGSAMKIGVFPDHVIDLALKR